MESYVTMTNADLREQGVDCVVYDEMHLSESEIAQALLHGRLDDLSALEFHGDLQGELVLGIQMGAVYIGRPEAEGRFTYRRARGGGLGLDAEQAAKLIQGHHGRIVVHL